MSPGRATVEGMPAVLGAMDTLAKSASDATKPAGEVVRIGLAAARGVAPVNTGELIGTLDGRADAQGAELSVGVSYAPFPEFGTRYVRAVRFMKAGADAMEAAAPDSFGRHLEAATTKAQR